MSFETFMQHYVKPKIIVHGGARSLDLDEPERQKDARPAL